MKLASLINLKALKEEYSSEYIEGDKVKFNPLLMKDRGFEDNLEHYDDLTGVVTKASQGELEVKLSKPIIPPGGGKIDTILLWKSEGDYKMIEKVEPGAFWDVQSGGGLKEGSMQARELADYNSLEELQAMYDQLMRDMEQEAEPEGGPIADQYADQMQDIEDAMQIKRGGSGTPLTYDQAIGRMNESKEKWDAIDVSRKAEKEISNKEWNERTAKKLDILKSLNAAGKFKKDWDEEKLQGWVDQNYSWEKLSKQFKLNEIDSEPDYEWEKGSKADPRNLKQDTRFTVDGKPVDTSSIEMSGMRPEWGPDDGSTDAYIEYATFIDGTELTADHMERFQDEHPDLTHEKAIEQMYQQEGSCGYSQEAPGGKELDTPGGIKGRNADARTLTMMREVIKKEIKKLHENK